MNPTRLLMAAMVAAAVAAPVHASEAEFLDRFAGDWSGEGVVRLEPTSETMPVSCDLDSRAQGNALSMDGACSALAVFARRIGADLEASSGTNYVGTYTGSKRGPAMLSGGRSGDSIDLALAWPDGGTGEGERNASMRVEAVDEGLMRLTTTEPHPETGEPVVTAQIDFSRQ